MTSQQSSFAGTREPSFNPTPSQTEQPSFAGTKEPHFSMTKPPPFADEVSRPIQSPPIPPSTSTQLRGLKEALSIVQNANPSTSISPTVPTIIRAMLRWNVPPFVKAPDHTLSTATRDPTVFDLHLDPRLSLKRVEYIPSLLNDLQLPIDKLLSSRTFKDILPSSFLAHHEEMVYPEFFGARAEIRKEVHLQEEYAKETARVCRMISTSILFPSMDWNGSTLFTWSHEPGNPHANGDGCLSTQSATVAALCREARNEINSMRKWKFLNFMTWEFKNLNIGTRIMFDTIVDSANELSFSWPRCPGWNDIGYCCLHESKAGTPYISGRPTSFDAKICPEWQWEGEDFPGSSENYTQQDSADKILIQVWSEAVQDDATFICLTAGNLEILGVRDRETQTLFLSDVIDVATFPNYIKLKTSLYISAILDTYSRASTLESLQKIPKRNIPDSFLRFYHGYREKYGYKIQKKINVGRNRQIKDFETWMSKRNKTREIKIQALVNAFKSSNTLTVRATCPVEWLRHPKHAVRQRLLPGLQILPLDVTERGSLHLVLCEKIGGKVYRCELMVSGRKSTQTLNIVAKIFGKGEQPRFSREWEAYEHPDLVASLPKFYGAFHVDLQYGNDHESRWILIMEDAGGTLEKANDLCMSQEDWSNIAKKVDDLHNRDFIHGALDGTHILTTQGDFYFISLGRTPRSGITRRCIGATPAPQHDHTITYPYTDERAVTYWYEDGGRAPQDEKQLSDFFKKISSLNGDMSVDKFQLRVLNGSATPSPHN